MIKKKKTASRKGKRRSAYPKTLSVGAKKEFSLKNEYKKSWDYLRESKKFIWITVGIFVFFALVGFFVPAPQFLIDKILEFMKELLSKTEGMGGFELMRFIFLNNVQSSFLSIVLGFFLGIFPMLATITNGYLLGIVSLMVVNSDGVLSLWRLLPHGIFELPAIFVSFGLGIKFGTFIFEKKKKKKFKEYFWNSLRVFLTIVFPLLIIAAIIEGWLMSVLG